MLSHLDAVTIIAGDVERTKAFYTDLLGFSVVPPFTSPEGDFVWLRSEERGSSIIVQDVATRADKPTQADIPVASGGLMLGFAVDDAEAAHRTALEGGYEIRTPVVDMGFGRTFGVKDPEGNYLQLFDVYPQVKELQRRLGLG
ncbi:VOC family protein [Streptomyces yaizuensis]|uniref:VOC family protein n=1 Tax=Streptomyces yaizuensis TaxID=2989713 RepID=A0ABQ5NRP6_9ACTN|nr:VOC family protein [Streptomyces sp. YSPA8]GLF93010.1 VOC family protein [Streptomyces sp. YSPA8]